MAEPVSHVQLGGLPWKSTSDEQTASMLGAGGQAISPEQAQTAANAQRDLSYVDQNWGAAGKAAMGGFSGLTLGMGPGALSQMGLVDPGHIQAAQASPFYTAGDVAGTILPALASGGDSFFARGLTASPAGLMGAAGSLSERIAGGLFESAPGLMGRLASEPLKMAARGATEGALLNMGHTIGDQLIQNHTLAAESILASGADGALMGGLLGAGLGTVGSLGAHAVESVGHFAKNMAGKGARGSGTVAKSLGVGESELEAVGTEGVKPRLKSYGDILEAGGSKVGDSTPNQIKAVKSYVDTNEAVRADVVKELTEQAPVSAPPIERLQARFQQDLVVPRAGTPNQLKAQSAVDDLVSDMAKVSKGQSPTWENLVKTRDQIAKTVESTKANPLLADTNTLKKELLNSIDSEIRAAMDGAEETVPGASKRYGAATQGLELARQLDENLGKKAAQSVLGAEASITPRDIGAFVGMTAIGHPASGVAWLAAKGLGRRMQSKMEPWMAEMAYNNSIGTKAATAEIHVKSSIKKSVEAFFSGASKAPYYAAQVKTAEKKSESKNSQDYSRKAYEDMASRTEALLSSVHQDRVRRYSESLYNQGYPDLAKSLMETNQRAVQYLMWNQPAGRQGSKGMKSLRPQPVSKVPTLEEYKMFRTHRGATKPTALLEDLQNGSLSRDAVQAAAYVYPEIWGSSGLVAQEVGSQIMAMKVAGNFMPMDKIVTLGIALNSPVDSTLEPDFINGVQLALNAPPANQPPSDSQNQSSGGMLPAMQASGLMTPLQTITFQG